jgi:hypothetical protein
MNQKQSRKFVRRVPLFSIIVTCLVLIGALPIAVDAAIAVIDTNNGAWDTGWGTPMRVDGDDAGVDDDLDIDTFWVNSDAASPTTYYFGVSTVAPLHSSGGVRICILMDCNGDGDVTDVEDKSLELNPGDTYYDANGDSSFPYDTNPSTDGEFVGRYAEAKTNTSGSISWATCMNQNPVVKAQVRGGFCPTDGTLYDETELRGYDRATAIRMRAVSSRVSGVWLLVGGLVLAGAATLVLCKGRGC